MIRSKPLASAVSTADSPSSRPRPRIPRARVRSSGPGRATARRRRSGSAHSQWLRLEAGRTMRTVVPPRRIRGERDLAAERDHRLVSDREPEPEALDGVAAPIEALEDRSCFAAEMPWPVSAISITTEPFSRWPRRLIEPMSVFWAAFEATLDSACSSRSESRRHARVGVQSTETPTPSWPGATPRSARAAEQPRRVRPGAAPGAAPPERARAALVSVVSAGRPRARSARGTRRGQPDRPSRPSGASRRP